MFRIGDFSRLGQVTVKTLHHYDELGLLRPARVDEETGYRYYSAEQLSRLNRILILKALGFSLDQVAGVLDDCLTVDELRGMLRLRRAEAMQRLREEEGRLAQVEAWLTRLQEERTLPEFDVVVKDLDVQLVASIREVVPDLDALAPFFPEIEAHFATHGAQASGPGMLVFYDREYPDGQFDAEAAYPAPKRVPDGGRVRIHEIPRCQVACVVYRGTYEGVGRAHQALGEWISANGYRLAGPNRVVFLECADPSDADGTAVVEIQYTVTK